MRNKGQNKYQPLQLTTPPSTRQLRKSHRTTVVKILLTLLSLCLPSLLPANSLLDTPSPKREVRAVWLTTIGGLDWPHSYTGTHGNEHAIRKQKEELCRILDQYQRDGINTVLLQTRIRATTIFPSAMEPWDGCLSGVPGKTPGYDALQFAIEECHRRGMELQAWVVSLPVGKWNALGCAQLRKKYPGLIRKIGPDGYMNPEDPRTARYIAEFCEDIVRRYDVDGIHLDYIRYPEQWKIRVPLDQARNNITRIVRAVHDRVKALKPWVKMSCSPVGKFDDLTRYWSHGWNAYTKVAQDAQGWLRSGLMDQLFPMMYFRGDQFFPFAIDWQEQSCGRIIAPGLGIYFLDPREGRWTLQDIEREMYVLRSEGLGHTFFRGRFLTDNTQGIEDFVQQFNRNLALVPAMTWGSATRPDAPTGLTIKEGIVRWKGSTPYYNIYANPDGPVDLRDASQLVAIRVPADSLIAPTDGLHFAVTGMDRYGNESMPVGDYDPASIDTATPPAATDGKHAPAVRPETEPAVSSPAILSCDGRTLRLPATSSTLEKDLYAIETLQGTVIATLPCRGSSRLDITSLQPGCYWLRSLNKRGVSHRLGYFEVKR